MLGTHHLTKNAYIFIKMNFLWFVSDILLNVFNQKRVSNCTHEFLKIAYIDIAYILQTSTLESSLSTVEKDGTHLLVISQ